MLEFQHATNSRYPAFCQHKPDIRPRPIQHTGCPSKTGHACTITYTTYPPLYGRLKIFTFNNHVHSSSGEDIQWRLKFSLKVCFVAAAKINGFATGF